MDGKGDILDDKVKEDSLKKGYLNWNLSVTKVSNAQGLGHEKDWISEERKAIAAGVGAGEKRGATHTGVRDTGGQITKALICHA